MSVLSWQSILLVGETGVHVPGLDRPAAYKLYHLKWYRAKLAQTHNFGGDS